jgi:citronellol/citronellal dehydrogenase
MDLKNKVLFITGASRGIGLAIALRAAKDGACVAIAAKTVTASDKLPGTIYTAADEIRAAGGSALAIPCDVRDEEQVKAAIAKTVETFGGIDIVINNAGAIQLTNTEQTEMKRFDLMYSVNVRAVYMTVKHALPYLKLSKNAHVLSLSPPINLDPDWLANHVAYTLSKYGMSMCTLGMAQELKKYGVAVNSLWPESTIDTSAIRNLLGGDESAKASRKPEIVADAAYWIFTQPSATCAGNFFIDTAVMKLAGVTDLSKYAVDPTAQLLPDFFLGKPPKNLPGRVKATKPKTDQTVEAAVGSAVKAGTSETQPAVAKTDRTDPTPPVPTTEAKEAVPTAAVKPIEPKEAAPVAAQSIEAKEAAAPSTPVVAEAKKVETPKS